MPPDDHERRLECRDDFQRIDGDIKSITKPGGTIYNIYRKIEEIAAMKVNNKIFMWVVGGVASLALLGFSTNLTYTYAVDKATASHVTKNELKEEVQESKEYFKEEIDELKDDVDKLTIQNAKDKQEILDAIRNNR